VPGAFLDADVIAGNKLITFAGAPEWLFGILQSAMWSTWLYAIGGRLKSDISFSPDLTYCTFPFPDLTTSQKEQIATAARGITTAREAHGGSSLADLYDPLATPADLLSAHRELDRRVDRLFTRKTRLTASVRLGILLEAYEDLSSAGQLAIDA
jgi:hypothetical protein